MSLRVQEGVALLLFPGPDVVPMSQLATSKLGPFSSVQVRISLFMWKAVARLNSVS